MIYAENQTGRRCRVRLWIDNDAAELHALVWEQLHHRVQEAAQPMAISTDLPLSRYIGLEQREPPPVAVRPIRMLLAVSNPSNLDDYNLPAANVGDEISAVLEAMRDLRQSGQIEVSNLITRSMDIP